jgi:hypothetical protein
MTIKIRMKISIPILRTGGEDWLSVDLKSDSDIILVDVGNENMGSIDYYSLGELIAAIEWFNEQKKKAKEAKA